MMNRDTGYTKRATEAKVMGALRVQTVEKSIAKLARSESIQSFACERGLGNTYIDDRAMEVGI